MSLSATQIALRRGRISSSDIAGVVGLSPWITPYGAWLRVIGQAYVEESDDEIDPRVLGHELEGGIARAAARRLFPGGCDLGAGSTVTAGDWRAATPDYIASPADGDPGLIECKLVGSRQWDAWRDGPPDYVLAQVQWQLDVCGFARAWIAALIGGTDLRTFPLRADAALQRGLVAYARPWWERHVRDSIAPPVDHSPEATRHLVAMFPAPQYALRPATPDEQTAARWLRDARKLRDLAERDYKAAANVMRQAIGPNEGLDLGGGERVTWKRSRGSTATDWEALVVALAATPEQIAEYTRVTDGFRRLVLPRAWTKAEED